MTNRIAMNLGQLTLNSFQKAKQKRNETIWTPGFFFDAIRYEMPKPGTV